MVGLAVQVVCLVREYLLQILRHGPASKMHVVLIPRILGPEVGNCHPGVRSRSSAAYWRRPVEIISRGVNENMQISTAEDRAGDISKSGTNPTDPAHPTDSGVDSVVWGSHRCR